MRWQVFYAGGDSCGSGFNAPEDIPGLGVIVIVQEHEDPQERPYLQRENDYYIWLGDRWQGCDLFRLWQYWFIEKHDFRKVALAGQTVSNDEYMALLKAAKELRDYWHD